MILLKIKNVYNFILSFVRVISASVNVVFTYDDKNVNTKTGHRSKASVFFVKGKSCFDRMSHLKWSLTGRVLQARTILAHHIKRFRLERFRFNHEKLWLRRSN